MKKMLTIEINGTGCHNRGAELMAIAIAERMRSTFSNVRIVVPPSFGTAAERSNYDFLTTWEFHGRVRGRFNGMVLRLLSSSAREALGIVSPHEVDVVLDASGFAFSDQWGPGSAIYISKKMKRRREAIPLIFLPQALGPFTDPKVVSSSKALFDRASLICARDSQSLTAARGIGISGEKLKQFADFTLGLKSVMPEETVIPEKFSAIVPNYRMLDKGGNGDSYLKFISNCIVTLGEKGMNPVFVLHDAAEDRKVIEEMNKLGHDIPIIEDNSPLVLKGILGCADLVVGSRFHALVSSLSQGVPCLGAGWSHKYQELFSDFGCEDFLVSDLGDFSKIESLIDILGDPDKYRECVTRIGKAGAILRDSNEQMWQEVEKVINDFTKSSFS